MINRRDLLASGAFLAASGLTSAGTLLARGAQRELPAGREALFDGLPDVVGGWSYAPPLDGMIDPVVTDTAFAQALAAYDRIIARDYLAEQLPRIMVNLCYKRVIAQEERFHRPELCYEAQGFAVKPLAPGSALLGTRQAGIARFLGHRSDRDELVSYIIRTGDATPVGSLATRAEILRQNLELRVPDGTMLRMSLLLPRVDDAAIQLADDTLMAFLQQLYAQSSPAIRALIA